MKKKVIAIVLAIALIAALVVGLVACGKKDNTPKEVELPGYNVQEPDYSDLVFPSDFKVGLITLHDKNSTYDANFINALEQVKAEFGLRDDQVIVRSGIGEDATCKQTALDLADLGCKIVFADSFGHEPFLMEAAELRPNVQFCHAKGTHAHTSNLANFANAFASIYEGRYLAGVAAGLKLQEMGKTNAPKIGYIGAFTYAEVISGYTSFYLGVKSIVPSVTMEVTFTGSWYDETAENNAAKSLIQRGCVLISQHADSWGAPNACEEAGVPNVSYNGSTFSACPDTFIVSSRIDWAPYYKYVIATVLRQGVGHVEKDWNGTIANGGVKLTNLGAAAAAGTVQKLVDVRNQLVAGTLHVFALSNFTVNGERNNDFFKGTMDAQGNLLTYLADVDDEGDYVGETDVLKGTGANRYFSESDLAFRSAPYFDFTIDGITLLNSIY